MIIFLSSLISFFLFVGSAYADTKISALPSASALTGVEQFPCVQSGVTDKCTVNQATTWVFSQISNDLTCTSAGVCTVTKTSGVAFGSLATLNTINNSNWSGTALSAANGGSPMTTLGDTIYGGASGLPTRLANGTNGQFLGANTGAAPSWQTPPPGTVTSAAETFTGGLISVAGSPITTSGTFALTVAGTSGGVPYFSSATGWASSAALTANAIVVGGGAGAAPSVLGSLGTTTTVLHGNASGLPTFAATSLTADVSGTLPVANGGTNATTANAGFNNLSPMTTIGDTIYGAASGVATRLANGTSGQFLGANTGAAPSWQTPAGGGASSPWWTDFSTAFIYPVFPQQVSASAGSAGGASILQCSPGMITEKMTLSGLIASVSKLHAGGNFQLAIYASSSGRPGSLIANSGSTSTAATGLITAPFSTGSGSSVQLGPGGAQGGVYLWFCSNRDDATVVFTPINPNNAQPIMTSMIGSTTAADLTSTSTGIVGLSCFGGACITGSGTFGTWPATLAGTTWGSIITRIQPVFYYQPASIP